MKNFLVYVQMSNGDFKVIKSDKPEEVEIIDRLPRTSEYNRFHSFDNYTSSDDDVKQFFKDLTDWNEQLKENKVF